MYVIRLEQLERQVLADRQALITRGVSEGLPTLDSEQERFDAWLVAEPAERPVMTDADVEQLELRVALGVAR